MTQQQVAGDVPHRGRQVTGMPFDRYQQLVLRGDEPGVRACCSLQCWNRRRLTRKASKCSKSSRAGWGKPFLLDSSYVAHSHLTAGSSPAPFHSSCWDPALIAAMGTSSF